MRVGIITVSDRVSRGEAKDISSEKIKALVKKINAEVVEYRIIPDEIELIKLELIRMADKMKLDLIITTGGTGLSDRDNTPEATLGVIEKVVPGISEIMRVEGFVSTPHSVLSRGVCGIRKKSLIINLPGSTNAVEQGLSVILPCLTHAIEIMKGTAVSHSVAKVAVNHEPHK